MLRGLKLCYYSNAIGTIIKHFQLTKTYKKITYGDKICVQLC